MRLVISRDANLEKIISNLGNAPTWMPKVVKTSFEILGRMVVANMQLQTLPNRYTGSLAESIRADYNSSEMELTVGPTAQRGRWDGGLILQLGTRPIPNAPWGPIARWATFRGLPAFPIVYKIRTEGVAAHPFVHETLGRSWPAIESAAIRIVELASKEITRL